MVQQVKALVDNSVGLLSLPGPDEYVMPGVRWGHYYALFTPAFWAAQAWLDGRCYERFSLGQTLEEEVAACLLGGYGIPSEVGLAAFCRVRDMHLLSGPPPSEQRLIEVLTPPLEVEGRKVRYRFAKQRSVYLSHALKTLHQSSSPPDDPIQFRNFLLRLRGIGPKTASWITRNWLRSDQVAIIDVHISRAGLLAGFYDHKDLPTRNYFAMETKFLTFADALGVRPSVLDSIIWRQMKNAGNIALKLIADLKSR